MLPGDNDLRIKESWDANAAAWTDAVRENGISSRAAGTDAAIIDAIMSCAPARVLDVGCGEGWLARRLAALGVQVTGIDGSAELLRNAREAGAGEFLLLGYDDYAKAPAAVGEDFDVAVFNFALLGEEITALLRAARKSIKVGGAVIVQTVHPLSAAQSRYEDGWRIEDFAKLGGGFRESMPWYFRTIATWLRVLAAASLDLIELREPVHPASGQPLSLILVAERLRS